MPLVESLPEFAALRDGGEAVDSPASEIGEPEDAATLDLSDAAEEIDLTDLAMGDEESDEFLDLGLELDEEPDESASPAASEATDAEPIVELAADDSGTSDSPDPATDESRESLEAETVESAAAIADDVEIETFAPAADPEGAPAAGDLEAEPVEAAAEPPSETEAAGAGVDLLDEILADGELDGAISEADKRQVNGIAHDVHGQIASHVSDDDHKGQYEVGIVYMDMGLYDQAIEAFTRAANGDDQRLKALEMKGSCLTSLGRLEEALAVFQQGLAMPGYPGRYYLGLLYEVGACLESLERLTEARDYFQRVAAVDQSFLDVSGRLARLDEQEPSVS
jgi:tetratricopeptide (TPR) repeat protein